MVFEGRGNEQQMCYKSSASCIDSVERWTTLTPPKSEAKTFGAPFNDWLWCTLQIVFSTKTKKLWQLYVQEQGQHDERDRLYELIFAVVLKGTVKTFKVVLKKSHKYLWWHLLWAISVYLFCSASQWDYSSEKFPNRSHCESSLSFTFAQQEEMEKCWSS